MICGVNVPGDLLPQHVHVVSGRFPAEVMLEQTLRYPRRLLPCLFSTGFNRFSTISTVCIALRARARKLAISQTIITRKWIVLYSID